MLRRAGSAVLAGLVIVYALAYADVAWRARSAYLEGEKYMAWSLDPALKRAALQAEFAGRERALRDEAAAGKLSGAELEQRAALLRFDFNERLQESSLKYAVAWYRTAVELFSPPESRWVALSRSRLAEAKALWKRELDAQKVPYKEYMLE